jgi:phage tail-like protein
MSSAARPTGPPYLRLGARTGWRPAGDALGTGVTESDGALVLGVAGRSPIAATEPFGTFGGRTLPRGLAVSGEDGRVFLADPERRVILTWQAGSPPGPSTPTAPFAPLWPARPRPPSADPYVLVRPTDVALSPAGDLVVADPGAGRVLVLAYPTARLRHVVELPGWAPTALAFDHAGRAYVADPVLGVVHRFWASWRHDPSFPHRSAGLGAPGHVALVRHHRAAGACRTCGGPDEPPGPVVVVLDGTAVTGLTDRGLRVPVTEVPELEPGPLRRDGDGTLHYHDPARPWADPLPLAGPALRRDGRHAGSGLPLLAAPRRLVRPQAAVFATAGLDGGRPGFAWDRVVLRADVPAGTRLLVSTRTDDSPLEPGRAAQPDSQAWSAPLTIGAAETPELLVQSPPGRYLWLRVELFGDGRATPRVEGIDVFGPRSGSVRHLPAAYHQDPESLRFLDRFLAYFDTVFAEVTAEHRGVAALLDPYAAPAGAALDWLGGWFDLHFLAEWSPALRRRMIAEAVAYARERGTVRGLRRVVQWHTGLTDPLPQIIEHHRIPSGGDAPYIGGEPLDATPVAHGCTIVLPARVAPDDAARARLERLITAHVPGHVRFRLRLVPAGVAVGRQSTVGVDTLVGVPSSGALGDARLGSDLATAGGPRAAVVPGRSLFHGWRQP